MKVDTGAEAHSPPFCLVFHFNDSLRSFSGPLEQAGLKPCLIWPQAQVSIPGLFARNLRSGFVVGLDLSKPMLRWAAAKAGTDGIKNLLFIHGHALDVSFPDNEFHRVNC